MTIKQFRKSLREIKQWELKVEMPSACPKLHNQYMNFIDIDWQEVENKVVEYWYKKSLKFN